MRMLSISFPTRWTRLISYFCSNRLNGGQPFVDLFMRPIKEVHSVSHGVTYGSLGMTLSLQRVQYSGTNYYEYLPRSFRYSGVVDFETEDSVRVENICYRDFNR